MDVRHFIRLLYFCSLAIMSVACQSKSENVEAADISKQLSTKTGRGIQAVVEIPAGTNRKIEFNSERRQFETDSLDGQPRIVDFLPYPGNYGFIPSTLMDEAEGGDGDALDVLIICESVATGTVMEILPIAALLLRDQGELDTKIIAVPVDSTLRTIHAATYEDWFIDYSAAKYIIEQWFLNYKGLGQTEFIGWKDAKQAMAEIEKWSVK